MYDKYYKDRVNKLINRDSKLAHYTSASAALNIINNEEIWLSNVRDMNDYKEVEIGKEAIINVYNTTSIGKRFQEILGNNKSKALEKAFNGSINYLYDTYAMCFTEHLKDDELGRLSMWRAYAPKNGVAIVFKLDPFINECAMTTAFAMPVKYIS